MRRQWEALVKPQPYTEQPLFSIHMRISSLARLGLPVQYYVERDSAFDLSATYLE